MTLRSWNSSRPRAGFIYRYDPRSSQGWINISGSLHQIAVGSANNIRGLNAGGFIYRFDTSSQTWLNIPGNLGYGGSVSVAFDGTVWGMNSEGFSSRFVSSGQHPFNVQTLHQLAVAADAAIWAVGQPGQGGGIFQCW